MSNCDWLECAFSEAIDFQEGPGILAQDFRPSGVPLVRLSGLTRGARVLDGCNYLDPELVERRWGHFRLKRGDILLSTSASLGRIATVDDEAEGAIPYTGIIRMRPARPDLDAPFIQFLLESPDFQHQVEAAGVGSVIRHFGPMHLRRMTVRLPPLAEQRAISRILGALDDKIDLNRRTSETLEAMARALFKSWFVDFDPVRAKKEGRKPEGMDAATAALFPDDFEESQLGPIPRGWLCNALETFVSALSGGTPSKSATSLWSGSIPWISPKAMKTIHVYDSDACVSPEAIGNGTRLALAGSTLVMVRGMGLHEEVRVSQAVRDVTFNQDVKALVPKGIEPALLLFTLLDRQADLLGRVDASGHGTGRLPSEVLLGRPIVVPAEAAQRALAQPFERMSTRIVTARQETDTLSNLRDALLPKLLSGELRVPEAERIVAEAV